MVNFLLQLHHSANKVHAPTHPYPPIHTQAHTRTHMRAHTHTHAPSIGELSLWSITPELGGKKTNKFKLGQPLYCDRYMLTYYHIAHLVEFFTNFTN